MIVRHASMGRRALLAAALLAASGALISTPAWAARPTLNYKSEVTVKTSPQKAWDSFKTFGAIHEWHPATEGTKLLVGENGKPLAVREFQLKGGGGFVISELLAYNEVGKRFNSAYVFFCNYFTCPHVFNNI